MYNTIAIANSRIEVALYFANDRSIGYDAMINYHHIVIIDTVRDYVITFSMTHMNTSI